MLTYKDLRVTTQTYIISTNLSIDCKELFERIECVPLVHPLSKNLMQVNPEEKISDGAIVYGEYKSRFKGTLFKKNRKKTMLNCITLIIKYDKYYNTKISSKGNLQVTGCVDNHVPNFILETFWNLLQTIPSIWQLLLPPMRAYVYPVMVNVSFFIGFEIDRKRLNLVINTKTQHISILEESDGYVGVNIKIFCDEEKLQDIPIRILSVEDSKWSEDTTRFESYLSNLTPKEKEKKLSKYSIITFLVFYSGKAIMSGKTSKKNREESFKIFMDIITRHREEIEVVREIEQVIEEPQPKAFSCSHENQTFVVLEKDKLALCQGCWEKVFQECFKTGQEPQFDWARITHLLGDQAEPVEIEENMSRNTTKPCEACKNADLCRFKITLKNKKKIFRCFECFKSKMLVKFPDIGEACYMVNK